MGEIRGGGAISLVNTLKDHGDRHSSLNRGAV